MRRIFAYLTIASFFSTSAFADPAVLTANVNFRTGPGTGFNAMRIIQQGEEVDIKECDSQASWCAVSYSGESGFVAGKYLNQSEADAPAWPRVFTTQPGATVTLFQPQITEWTDFRHLEALIATELKLSADAKPVYGIIGVTASTIADDETGNVTLSEIKTTRLDFSTLDRKQLSDLTLQVGTLMPTEPIVVSQERLTASIADYKRLANIPDIKADPPPIFTSETPAVLVQTNGKPVFAPVKGAEGLSFVVNTNWDLFKVDATNTYYLRHEKNWLTSTALERGWVEADTVPDLVSKLPADKNWEDARAALPPVRFAENSVPTVFYSDKPAELINFEGKPILEPVEGTGLEWASNSTGAIFYHTASKTWYALLSGRWFSSASLEGAWTFASTRLPADFLAIPDDTSYSAVRASIPGTSESAEARLKASIPKMARVLTDGSVKVEVSYNGEPVFEPIKGTSMFYAINANEQVIKVADKYFVLKDGIWFVGDAPSGPFAVARAVAEEIYTIPPSSPVYNATYVRIYEAEPDAVWYGYTLGYLGAYLAWDTLVWGSGWYYPPYWDDDHDGNWTPYPPPISYGVGAYYNPTYGTFGRYGYAYGPERGLVAGSAYNPRTGTHVRAGAVAGPNGQRGFISAYNPRTGNAFAARGGQNVYGSWGSVSVKHGGEFARISGGSTGSAGGLRWRNTEGDKGFLVGSKGGDVYAGRDGSVYRRQDGEWQKHSPDGWQPVQRPDGENRQNARQRDGTKRPQATQRAQNRHDSPAVRRNQQRAPDHLNFDRSGRQFGNQYELNRNYGRRSPQTGGNFQNFDRGGFQGGSRGNGGFHGGGGRGGGGAVIRGGGGRGGGGRGR